jgi:hypothetical protein
MPARRRDGAPSQDAVDGARVQALPAKTDLERCNLGVAGRECARRKEKYSEDCYGRSFHWIDLL